MLNLLDPVADIDTNSHCHRGLHTNGYCNCNVNGDTDTNAYRKCPAQSNANRYCYCYGYANVDVYGYSYCDHDTYTPAYSVTKGYRAAKASADSPAETVSLACDGRAETARHSTFNAQ